MKPIFFIFALLHASLWPVAYSYPVVAFFDSQEKKYIVLEQKSLQEIQLWQTDAYLHKVEKLLPAMYHPASVALLPNNVGFSFIDRDHIRIKQFCKRSPKTIEFDWPLYDITSLYWIDQENFYFSAREHKRFGIYQGTIDHCCVCLCWQSNVDYMYPQKIDNTLFCIERSQDGMHRIVQSMYPDGTFLHEKLYAVPTNRHDISQVLNFEILVDFHEQALAFLVMINKQEGFVLGYPKIINTITLSVSFDYYYIYAMQQGQWQKDLLFSFSIPFSLLFDQYDRLHESIIPLLPYYDGTSFYFISTSLYNETNKQLLLYAYDKKTRKSQLITMNSPYNIIMHLACLRCGVGFLACCFNIIFIIRLP